jgi:hypothetical protein
MALAEWRRISQAEKIERKRVLAELEVALGLYEDDEVISWFYHEIDLQEGSSLYEVYNPGKLLLNQLLQTSPVRSAITQVRGEYESTCVKPSGALDTLTDIGWKDLVAAGYFDYSQSTLVELKLIADIAKVAGGYIWPSLEIRLDQWFEFHEITFPQTKAQVRGLIDFLKFDPYVDEPGNYWELFEVDDHASVTLSAEQFSAIRQATAKLTPGKRLLTVLHGFAPRLEVSQENAAQRITDFVRSPQALTLAKRYLAELGWFGNSSGQEVSENMLRQLLVTAIILDLHPAIERLQRRKSIFGFELYGPANVDRHSSVVCEQLTAVLRGTLNIDPELAPVATHLILARMAPELLVRDIPKSINLGSIAWINFSRGVALVEAAKAGASRVLTHGQVMAYADLEPVSDAQKHLRELAMIDPIVNWSLLNQIVTPIELEQAEVTSTQRAIEAFEQHSEKFVQIARAFSTALPSRADIARAALRVAAPGCDTLDEKALSEEGGQQVMSMVDLHQSGDLVTAKWDRRTVYLITNGIPRPPINYNPSGISLYKRYPKLLKLTSCDEEMDRQLAVHLKDLNGAMLSTVKLALALMPEEDLRAFLSAQIHFFTVRGSAIYKVSRRASAAIGTDQERETQQSRDAATGRFGLVMWVSCNNTITCYELFTSRGEFRKNNVLGELIVRERKMEQRSRMSRTANLTLQQSLTYPQNLPLNLNRYTHAVAEDPSVTSSMAVIDYFGELPAPAKAANPKQGFYQRFNDPNIARVAEFIVSHRPFLHAQELRELVRIPTPLESGREEGERLITYFIDLVVPFKKCIEDIASGEHDKMVDGAYGCLMDGIGLIGTVAGAGAKVLSISAKAISTTSKAAKLTKLVFTSAVSLFNPLDGVPSGLQAGAKLAHKGLLRFNRKTHELLIKANRQLHTLGGRRRPWDLIESAGRTQWGLGSWRPRGAASDAVMVVAARRDNKWFALDRRGNLWGKPLNGFSFDGPLRLPYTPKTLPESYTRRFIETSLPLARAKIDNAIAAFDRLELKQHCSRIMKALFGDTSSVATERLVNYLRFIRFDFAGFSLSNIVLDAIKEQSTLAAFDVNSYNRWKNADASNRADIAFVEIYTKNLNKHFVSLGFNHDVVADDLIHELFHASAQTDDIGYAIDAQIGSESGQTVDVAALLNIASGCLPVSEEATACYSASKAFENADSLAVATSLLSQLCTDKATFERNMMRINLAIAASGGRAIVDPVLITLNKPV